MKFEVITIENFAKVREIYQKGIDTGVATFETSAPPWEKWDEDHLPFGRIVLVEDGLIKGWAALTAVSNRCVYGGVAEVSVYVDEKFRGQGVGRKLLNELISISEENEIWTLQSGIMRDNFGSIILHEKCGFRKIGYRERIAKLDGVWRDNILMERRSKKVGI